jgi:NAD(P)-dependent dehydrogenase (short-subunit alcohol dehydrogenase family)
MSARLTGKIAIVTGGAAGIGKAMAQALFDAGAAVLIADIRNAREAAFSLDPEGKRVHGIEVDVASDAQVAAMAEEAERRYGGCDILVNNAGIATGIQPRSFLEIEPAEWHKVYDVNVVGIFRCCKALVPAMERRGGGRVINIASAAAFKGVPYLLHYVSSKGAVLALTKSLAKELGAKNILVNAVAPGFTLSEATTENKSQMDISRGISLQGRAIPRDQYPEDLVGTILFFAGPESAFITGQTLVVDGGTYLH